MTKINSKKKVIKIGSSLGCVIDKTITNTLDIKNGDLLELSYKKIKKGEKK